MAPASDSNPERCVEPLDAVVILFMACTITLFVLWLAGPAVHSHDSFELPAFIQTAYKSVWSYVTGAGGSVLLGFIRSNKARKENTRAPNYLVWTFGTVGFLFLLTFGVAYSQHLLAPPPPSQTLPSMAVLRFRVNFTDHKHPNLSFKQREPRYLEQPSIGPTGQDFHYQENVIWPPDATGRVLAKAERVADESTEAGGSDQPMQFCFQGSSKPPAVGTPFEVHMQCAEGKPCDFDPDDYGWASACVQPGAKAGSAAFHLVPVVYGAQASGNGTKPGWRVPSLTTLQKMTDRGRVGYTEFSIRSDLASAPNLQKADLLRYQIAANGQPLYVDGWPPADMVKSLNPSSGLDFSFGMENLSFSGADQGCEKIEVTLEFLQGDEVLRKVTLDRRYAALRDAVTQETTSPDGLKFIWGGRYLKPKNEDRSEVFVLSTSDLDEAMRTKARIDRLRLPFNGMTAVAVLRPPLNDPQYGLVVGLLQPTGQIKFTFDPAAARALLDWASQMHAANRTAFRRVPFLYQMRTGETGAGKLESCGPKAAES